MPSPIAVDVIHAFQVNHNIRGSWQHVHDSFAQDGAFVAGYDATVAAEDKHVARYLRLYC